MSTTLRSILFGLLGAGSLLAGVMAADIVVDDRVVEVPAGRVAYPVSAGNAAFGDEPAGVLVPVAVEGPEALFDDATLILPTVFDEAGTPDLDTSLGSEAGAPPSSPSIGGDGGGSAPGGSPSVLPPPAGAAGGGSPGSLVSVVRFLDMCAQNPGSLPCPAGIAATVLFSGSVPPLQIEALPEATSALHPGLRCDPGWPSADIIPVAILSNRPFSLLHVSLQSGDGTVLIDEANNLRSEPSEHVLYDQRVKDGKAMFATVQSGFHTCVQLRLDRGSAPVDRNGPFRLAVAGYAGQDALTQTFTFTGSYHALRPPVRILPLDENRAYMIVPQRADDTAVVWVFENSSSAAPSGCSGTPPPLDPRAVRRSPLAAPVQFSGLDSADYPWDRAYSHYTLWDLSLDHSTSYTLCAHWVEDGRTEEWSLQTPDGFELTVYSGSLRHTRTRVAGTLLVHMYGVEKCFVANPHFWAGDGRQFPERTVYGDDTSTDQLNAYMCRSLGGRIGSEIELRALFPDGSNEVYGVLKVPMAELIANCGPSADLDKPPCERRLEWRNQRVLCGGGLFDPSCQGDLWFGLEVKFSVDRTMTNLRMDPRDWGISQIARLGPGNDTVPLP